MHTYIWFMFLFRQMLLAFGASRGMLLTANMVEASNLFSCDPKEVVKDVKMTFDLPSLKMILLNLVTHGISTTPKR